ncbi:MAG: DUF3300 domain-containing protein [Ectothiorhodospiraceae bacterium]|nr:DUF3300 domain-containing protein [Ectothiorhodospiraceae bacterium]
MIARFPHLILSVVLLFGLSAVKAQQDGDSPLDEGELRQLVAPIALYPDSLLSTVLIASTYPLEVVEAARWRRDNAELQGADAVEAVSDRDWDSSVRSLVAFPDVLERMSSDLDWTARLGDAVLFPEEAVMDAIQDLRARADAHGSLEQMEHVRVEREREVIVLHPRYTEVVYVPYYSPRMVYGGWWWPGYQPVYWYPPAGHYGRTGFYWSGSYFIRAGFFYSSLDWGPRHVVVVNVRRPPARFVSGKPYLRPGGYEHWRYHQRNRHRHTTSRHERRQASRSSMSGSQLERAAPPRRADADRGRRSARHGGDTWVYGSRQNLQRHRSGARVEAPPERGRQGTVRRSGSSLRDSSNRPSRHSGTTARQRGSGDMQRPGREAARSPSRDFQRGGSGQRGAGRDFPRHRDATRSSSGRMSGEAGSRGARQQWGSGASRSGGGSGIRSGGGRPSGVESRGRGGGNVQGRGQRGGGNWSGRGNR